jgi:hypothetical protein
LSKREELEARIKEQRTLEANKKGFVGAAGKIGTVLRMLGQDIVAQYDDVGFGYLPEDEPEEPKNASEFMRRIPTMEIEGSPRPGSPEWSEAGEANFSYTRRIGMHFDGLGRGMHLEIQYSEEKSELSLTYKGYLAYRETMGEIDTYVPNEEWEGWVERLYRTSREIQRKEKEEEFKNKAEEAEKEKKTWWESMLKRWGNF